VFGAVRLQGYRFEDKHEEHVCEESDGSWEDVFGEGRW
jgi:hypothetical protein